MKYLTVTDLIFINQEVLKFSGGSIGIRELGLIDSAVNRPKSTFDGEDLYPSLFAKAAALFHSVIFNHAFLDGNKRTAIASAAQFLFINGYEIKTSNEELENFTVEVVVKHLEIEEIAIWLEKNSNRLDEP